MGKIGYSNSIGQTGNRDYLKKTPVREREEKGQYPTCRGQQ
jgi:hypothetical protein